MKKFKHKKTGEIATYKDGVLKSSGFAIELGVEPSSNFWEEVIEYPIGTKIYNSQTNGIYTKQVDGWYNEPLKTAYTDEMIGSRKHLTILVNWNIKNNVGDDSEANLKDIEHYTPKTPLFQTEDGVDIFKNDEVYFVNKIGDVFHTNHLKIKKYQSHLLYFSTKEAAEEYILMNKPCLSINDVLNSQDGLLFSENKLRQLVKTKL